MHWFMPRKMQHACYNIPMPIDPQRVRLICFDVDGTLADTDDQWVSRLASALQLLPRIFPRVQPERIARRTVMALETPGNLLFNIPDQLGLDDEISWCILQLNRLGIGKRKPPFWLVPGVLELLDGLTLRYPLAIVSARDEPGTMAFLNFHHLTPRFQSIITGQTCPHTKPFPDPIVEAARRAGVQPSACLMVGDTTVDMIAAKRAGAQSVGVLCGFGEEAELRKAGADGILASTAELASLLPR